MEDVFGTGHGLAEPSEDDLGIGIDEPAGAGPDDGGNDGGFAGDGDPVDGDGEPGGDSRTEHPQGRAFRTMRENLAARDREIARLREVEKTAIRYEERMRMLSEQRQQTEAQRRAAAEAEKARQAAASDPEPVKDEDPIGWNEWRIRQLDRRLDMEAQQREQAAQEYVQQQRQQVIARIAGEYTTWENRFALERPDYGQAFNHVAGAYAQMYRLRGVPEERIVAALEDERARLIRDCLQINQQDGTYQWIRNPAQVIYELAHTLGYGAQAPQGDEGYEEAPPQVQRRDPRTARLERSVAAASRSGTQGRSGGSPASNRWTLERFNALSDAEAQRFMEQYPELAQELLSPNG